MTKGYAVFGEGVALNVVDMMDIIPPAATNRTSVVIALAYCDFETFVEFSRIRKPALTVNIKRGVLPAPPSPLAFIAAILIRVSLD